MTYEKQQGIYDYGNIFHDGIVESLVKQGIRITKSEMIYRMVNNTGVRKFLSYKRQNVLFDLVVKLW